MGVIIFTNIMRIGIVYYLQGSNKKLYEHLQQNLQKLASKLNFTTFLRGLKGVLVECTLEYHD